MVQRLKKTRCKNSSNAASESNQPSDPATQYARDAVDGKIVTGELVRLACERHLDDLATAPARGYIWMPDQAQLIYDFCALVKHSKGRWAGQPLTLEPWEYFFLGSIWGWRCPDGTRRFREVHLEVARKNGKTFLAAVLALALLVLDGERGAEVYCVATKLDQSRITHEACKRVVAASPALMKRVKIFKTSLSMESTESLLQPLGRESGSLDGLNIHGSILDELHAWKDELLYDVIETATGARDQPLAVRTTTAGFDTQTLWWTLRLGCIEVLKKEHADDRLFALIYTLDEGDDWKDETKYIKANPNVGVSVKMEDLIAERDKAIRMPPRQNAFRRLRLNVVTGAFSSWIPVEFIDACAGAVTPEMLAGRKCYAGVDMSTSQDLTAVALLFPPLAHGAEGTDGKWIIIPHAWLPEEEIDAKSQRDRQQYRRLADEGWMTLIPGKVIKHEWVKRFLIDANAKNPIDMIVFDRAGANWLADELRSTGITVTAYGQGMLSMKNPVVDFERLVMDGQILHNGSPVLRSCVANVTIHEDDSGNRKPTKKKSTGRIDVVIAVLMPLGVAMDQMNVAPFEVIILGD